MRRFSLLAIIGLMLGTLSPASADMVTDCYKQQDMRRAEQACTDAIHSGRWSGSDLAWAYTNRGIARYNLRRLDEAIKDYEEALRLSPGYFDAHYGLGQAYCELGDPGRAIDWYSEAISGGAWDISDAQAFLSEEGFYRGRSGHFDGETRRALQKWARWACR